MARTYKRDGNGRFAGGGGSSGGGGGKRPAAKSVSRGVNRLTRDNAGKITSVGGSGATARGGRLKTAAGNNRAMQTAKVSGSRPAGTMKGKIKRDPGAAGKIGQGKATAKPTTQKERWAARAKMLNNAADKNDAKAKKLHDANDTTGNTAFNTQPGKIPGRARMNAATERSFQMNEKARQQRSRAENLTNMATTNKGDAAKRRAARAEQVKASYGGIKKGTIVEPIMGLGGAATVIRANAKSVTMKMSDGSIMKEPYYALKLKSPTLGSSKVVDNAKVNRMADRLGAKSRAPKSNSPVKNANTVAVRAKAVAFLKGKGGTFPNSSTAIAAMAANIRNRPRFSTGSTKPAAPKPTNAAPKATAKPKTGQEIMKAEVRKVQNKKLRDINAEIKAAGPNAINLRVEKLALQNNMLATQSRQTAKQVAKSEKQTQVVRGRIAEMRRDRERIGRAAANRTRNADARNSAAPMSKASFAPRPSKKTIRSQNQADKALDFYANPTKALRTVSKRKPGFRLPRNMR